MAVAQPIRGEERNSTRVRDPAGQEHRDEHADEAHSEFQASYRFECAAPDALTQLEVRLFELFPATEEVEAQVISGAGQTAVELTAAAPNLAF